MYVNIEAYAANGMLVGKYKTVREASEDTGFAAAAIYNALRGDTYTCGGLTWKADKGKRKVKR